MEVTYFNSIKTVSLFYLALLVLVEAAYLVPDLQTDKQKSVLLPICPDFCLCDQNSLFANCTPEHGVSSLADVHKQKWLLVTLQLSGNYTCLPVEFLGEISLQTLKFTDSFLTSLSCETWMDLPNIVEMDLSRNYISFLRDQHFVSSEMLQTLNLSNNAIYQIDSGTFEKQHLLEKLDLSHNQLVLLHDDVFNSLTSLTYLDLSYNYLNHIHDSVFRSLQKLSTLNLNNNRLVGMTFDTLSVLPSIHSISLSGNQWECSCMLETLLKYVQSNTQKVVDDIPALCSVPESHQHMLLSDVHIADLPCPPPNISQVSHSQNFLARKNIYLSCGTSVFPHAQIFWKNAWGQVFAHPSVRLDWESLNVTSVKTLREYIWPECFDRNSMIRAEEDGGLHIENIHGSFAGEYTCFAVNHGGRTNITIDVGVISLLRPAFHESLIYGAATSGLMLLIGIFVGIIKTCRSCCKKCTCCCCRCCCCCRNSDKECEKEKEAEEYVSAASSMLDDYDHSYYKSDDDFSGSRSALSWGQTSRSSPQKCNTPTVESKERWQNISGTLDEVKIQLERKMEKVRCHVHSIKESGSQYIMTIKDTGSQAATKVKAGMVLGVEQVKSGVMSMKEFCGTGEMGTQTISVISVSTDIDTNQQTEVVKSMKLTYV